MEHVALSNQSKAPKEPQHTSTIHDSSAHSHRQIIWPLLFISIHQHQPAGTSHDLLPEMQVGDGEEGDWSKWEMMTENWAKNWKQAGDNCWWAGRDQKHKRQCTFSWNVYIVYLLFHSPCLIILLISATASCSAWGAAWCGRPAGWWSARWVERRGSY